MSMTYRPCGDNVVDALFAEAENHMARAAECYRRVVQAYRNKGVSLRAIATASALSATAVSASLKTGEGRTLRRYAIRASNL